VSVRSVCGFLLVQKKTGQVLPCPVNYFLAPEFGAVTH
jgi:hypothetical protein